MANLMHNGYELRFPVNITRTLSFIMSLLIKYSCEAFYRKGEDKVANILLILSFSVGKIVF